MSDDRRVQTAVEALEQLGLNSYEARSFVALHRLGSGTARDVHRLSEVPQSRVYGVMERLQDRGLVDIQASTPKRYRPVGLEDARARLREELEVAEEQAFGCLDGLGGDDSTERGETVWMVHGRDAIADRVITLVETARRRVVFGAARPAQVPTGVGDALEKRGAAGVRVVAMGNRQTATQYPDSAVTVDTSAGVPAPPNAARVLLVDDATILMSTLEADASTPDGRREVGMWTAETGLGRMLVGLMDGAMADTIGHATGDE
jgi:sugar-specific transcriptional regulator TrmB